MKLTDPHTLDSRELIYVCAAKSKMTLDHNPRLKKDSAS